MTTTYNPAEVERLVREAREEILRRQTATRCDSCGGLIMHRSEHWLAAMADQLESARTRIRRLEHELAGLGSDHDVATRLLIGTTQQAADARTEIDRLRQQVAELLRRPLDVTVDELQAQVAKMEIVHAAAIGWSDAREDWQLRQTFSSRCTLDEAGDTLQAVLKGDPAPPKGERAAAIVGALAGRAAPLAPGDSVVLEVDEQIVGVHPAK